MDGLLHLCIHWVSHFEGYLVELSSPALLDPSLGPLGISSEPLLTSRGPSGAIVPTSPPPRIDIEPFPRLLNRLRVQSQHTSQRGTWGLEHYHQPASSRILRRMSLIETRGQQNNAPPKKKVHILFPGTGKHVGLHGKGELWVQMELMFQDLVMGRLSRWVQCYHKDPYKWKGKAEKLGLWSSLVA